MTIFNWSRINFRAPQSYHFAGKISINGRYINITGDMINIKVEPELQQLIF